MDSRKTSLNQDMFMSDASGVDGCDGSQIITMRRQEVLKSLECPVCFELIFPPVKDCCNGHHLCNICIERVPECPQCKQPTGVTLNIFAGDFVEKYVSRCTNHLYGCQSYEWKENIQCLMTHEESCKFRKIQCWVPNCVVTIFPEMIADHWTIAHGIERLDNDEKSYAFLVQRDSMSSYTSKAFHLQHNGHSFLAIFQMLKNTKEVSVYVYGYCPKDILPYYQSHITFIVTHVKKASAGKVTNIQKWQGPVNHELESPFNIEQENKDFHAFLFELDEQGELDCVLNIKIVPRTALVIDSSIVQTERK